MNELVKQLELSKRRYEYFSMHYEKCKRVGDKVKLSMLAYSNALLFAQTLNSLTQIKNDIINI